LLFLQDQKECQIFPWNEGAAFIADSVISVGVFDGVHLGHRALIGEAVRDAKNRGTGCYILTFDKDPEELFKHSREIRKLLGNEDRLRLLSTLGADGVIVVPFTFNVAAISAKGSLEALCAGGAPPRAIHVGKGFRFGHNREGNTKTIEEWCASVGCVANFHGFKPYKDEPVSSTRVRNMLEISDIEHANELLGRPHFIRATVVKGRGVGTSLGFSTANLEPVCDVVTIGEGVYGGYVKIHGTLYKSAIAVGPPKTFGDLPFSIEAHILDFDSNIYFEDVEAYFISYLRPMIKFDSFEQLIGTVNDNIEWVRNNLSLF
jgi:riboflavin kinase/FMN adenylyltransferase